MKKSKSKLQFNKTTIRVLQGDELSGIVGAAPTNDCTKVGPTCSGKSDDIPCNHTQHCPPQHSRHCPPSHHQC
jgi:hypothetical protein